MSVSVDQLSINTLRFLAVEAIQKANTGHPGMPMGCAPIAYTLYTKYMKYNPQNPLWLNRDRFILSAGHGSMLLYGILHLSGYDISLEDLKNFRQWESKTPGHPEFNQKLGIETTTGPLGQGFANAVGMAIAKSYLASIFNKDDIKILDHFIYGICSDGELMEGISHEAASLAGHLKLGKLIFFYDDNGISIDGKTSLSFSENIEQRFDAYGWHVEHISDVNDLSQIETALLNAQIDERPSLIITKTHIGFGSPNKQDTSGVHGSPLGSEEIKLTKKNLEWEYEESFYVPEEVKNLFEEKKKKHQQDEDEWNKLFAAYKEKYPQEAKLFLEVMSGNFGDEWISKIPTFADDGKKLATRQASGKTINAMAASLPTFIGGSADLAPSNNTYLNGFPAFSADNKSGRNFHFGIREHAMASLMNGMAMYGGVIPFGGTFLVFSDYLRPAIRLASLSKIKVIYVFTHDTIGLGEDGPTHQPVEHLASLRAIPGLVVLRPADANETASAWKFAIQHHGSPVALLLTRQGLPVLDQTKYPSSDNLFKGAYILKDADKPEIILMASGSEVEIILKAAEKLESEGKKVRVVSFPSWELFELQSEEYKNSVLPKEVKARIAVEASIGQGWHKYTGDGGKIISIETYGASAPYEILYEKYGITVENILLASKSLLK
ncbi:MAG: transketolase [Ignavibacteriaceae bacterium]|nr:transketolase [Ignavibacteriaceae bacterium]